MTNVRSPWQFASISAFSAPSAVEHPVPNCPIRNPQSAIDNPQSAIDNPQSRASARAGPSILLWYISRPVPSEKVGGFADFFSRMRQGTVGNGVNRRASRGADISFAGTISCKCRVSRVGCRVSGVACRSVRWRATLRRGREDRQAATKRVPAQTGAFWGHDIQFPSLRFSWLGFVVEYHVPRTPRGTSRVRCHACLR